MLVQVGILIHFYTPEHHTVAHIYMLTRHEFDDFYLILDFYCIEYEREREHANATKSIEYN